MLSEVLYGCKVSALDEFLHNLVGIDSLLGLRLELFDKLVRLFLAPLVAHSHQ